MLKNLHATYFFVSDVKLSAAWYQDLFNINMTMDGENFAYAEVGEQELCFHQADEKSPVSTGGSVGYWKVTSLRDMIYHVCSHGGTLYRGPIAIAGTSEGICQIKDPFGNIIGFQGRFHET